MPSRLFLESQDFKEFAGSAWINIRIDQLTSELGSNTRSLGNSGKLYMLVDLIATGRASIDRVEIVYHLVVSYGRYWDMDKLARLMWYSPTQDEVFNCAQVYVANHYSWSSSDKPVLAHILPRLSRARP